MEPDGSFPCSQQPATPLFIQFKVKMSLFLPKHHAMKTYGGAELQLHAFLT
jgi:hypothetical protein